jgi:thiopurine S-methyltransferase
MEPTFWQHRWAEGRTGWHQPEANRLLVRHWPVLSVAPDCRVFVPLCGKSLDMAWLADQGHQVFGVELAPEACEAFFAERGLTPAVDNKGAFRRYRAGAIELWAGDAFELTAADLSDCAACYDRAALIALPPDLRRRYVTHVLGLLPLGCRALLITLEYPSAEKQGPPFSVDEAEIHRLFEPHWRVSFQDRRDILARESGFREEGVTRLHTAAYRLRKLSTG